MTEERLDPDTILENLKRKESQSKKGKLRIFLGMSPGVGKTFAMLTNAKERIKEGVDVKIAVVETHGRKETLALLDDLSVIHKTKIQYKGIEIEEMDLDSILTLKPQLVIIDELAHSNAPNSRHPKRYQDVIEIINSGINVYTTLNVQHIESRAEAVYQITGIRIQETVPDSILDMAEEITLIDLSPEELRQRLEEGKVYLGDRAVTAANNFFRTGNLTALREIALRITAEHVNKDLRNLMSDKRISGPWKTSERIMVAVAGTPFSESLIRWTRKSADSLGAPWTAVYIDTHQHLSNEEQNRLNNNLALSRQLGAEVIIRSGIDVAEMLLKVARENNITQICIGKPAKLNYLINRKSFIHRLIEESGDIDIHMIRVSGQSYESKKQLKESKPKNISQYLYASAVVTLV
ncbi:MAG: two-component sensor histidine kinase, partial [Proteobacteria bacterium]|nr:two-component sensor histidine kinase [Pseudomonadota bacterium]